MPLTEFQRRLLADLAGNELRYLAGGAALHFAPNSTRFSDDLDFFHDSEARVAQAFAEDRVRLIEFGYEIELAFALPGFVRATISRGEHATRVDWAHDSAWRFMPLVRDEGGGWLLHPVDLAVNKVLVIAGRDEPRDFVDLLFAHETILPIAGLCWAASGKDPGVTPLSLIELLRRRGKARPEEFERLQLAAPFDYTAGRATWQSALTHATAFVRERPANEIGCLYYSPRAERFTIPSSAASLEAQGLVPHFGAPGGVVPTVR